MSGRRSRKKRSRAALLAAVALVLVASIGGSAALLYHPGHASSVSSQSTGSKYIILYINQGNGAVNETNFDSMLTFASSQGFNTLFFQVYRQGSLLFDASQLVYFVDHAHAQGMKIFFSLYLTNASQTLPTSVYGMGEDGVSLDMSTLSIPEQSSLLASLRSGYGGTTAITTTDLALPLNPDILVLETYTSQIQQYSQYIHPGVVASVGVFATTSQSDYEQEYQYALANSSGVMVFDYAGLLKSGY
jgi:hypothetical protein